MRLPIGLIIAGLTSLIATTIQAQSIAIPVTSKSVSPIVASDLPQKFNAPQKPRASTRAKATLQAPVPLATTGSVEYTYDSLGRLIGEEYPTNTLSHSYDAAGNRTSSQTQ